MLPHHDLFKIIKFFFGFCKLLVRQDSKSLLANAFKYASLVRFLELQPLDEHVLFRLNRCPTDGAFVPMSNNYG